MAMMEKSRIESLLKASIDLYLENYAKYGEKNLFFMGHVSALSDVLGLDGEKAIDNLRALTDAIDDAKKAGVEYGQA